MAELLPGQYARDVHLHNRHQFLHAADRIGQRDGSVRIAAGIQDNAVVYAARLVNAIDQFAFDIGLEVVQFYLGKHAFELLQVGVERALPVNVFFALAQQVQVGPVHNQ